MGVEAGRMGVSVLGSPLLCPWRRGKDICGVLSPLIMASLLHDQDKGPISSPLGLAQGWGTQGLLGEFSTKEEGWQEHRCDL